MKSSADPTIPPNFIIVGAPRSGTTAMATYLSEHEGVLFSDPKEPHFFGSDLKIQTPFRDPERYRALFDGAGNRLTGEGSVFYLLSTRAAQEIASRNPSCKIIAMLRNPVEVMHSLYWNNLLDGRHEDLDSFEDALEAEPLRRQGMHVPSTCTWPDALRYRDVVRYPEQLVRYFEALGSEQVHVVTYDRLREDVGGVYRDVLRFLNLDEPMILPDFRVINQARIWRSRLLRDIRAGQRLPLARKLASRFLNTETSKSVSRFVGRVNTKAQSRPALSPALRQSLTEDCAEEVRELEYIIGQNLRTWLPG